jgi:threonine dehydrogenase-like Zn-dependent dehydrogenase
MDEPMKALLVERLPHRFAAARVAAAAVGSGAGIGLGPIRMTDLAAPAPPDAHWQRIRPRLAGICGSDLATLDGATSRFFEPIVSFPFVPGHEVVADALGGEHAGHRVVLEPVLACAARGLELCAACAAGDRGRCVNIGFGHLQPGLQTGYCADTGGGWSEELIAHDSQLHRVPEALSDDQAVLVEPCACAVHAVHRGTVRAGETVVVIGAGTLGLLTVAALRHFLLPARIIQVAKHPIQRDLSRALGADSTISEDELVRTVRRVSGSLAMRKGSGAPNRLTGGADVVFDCVGSARSLAQGLEVARPGGRIILVGMPGTTKVDLAPLWQREVTLSGSYAYGTEDRPEGPRSTFDLAFELVGGADISRLVSARYPLERYEEAVRHAAGAGRRGAVKIVFDLRRATPSWQRSATAPGAEIEEEQR